MTERDPRETTPREKLTDYDDVDEYTEAVDHDKPEERREVRAGETDEPPTASPDEAA